MEYIIVVIIGVVSIWAVCAAFNSSKKRKEQEELSKSEELKVRITGDEPVKKPEVMRSTSQESLDEVYAKKNNLWICSRCETINRSESNKCVACGRSKYKADN